MTAGDRTYYTHSCDDKFDRFLVDRVEWEKKTRVNPTRGFGNDPKTVPAVSCLSAEQKVVDLELMLGQIANFCPIIARNSIIKNSMSLKQIGQTIRLHFGFQSTGGHFLDLAEIKLEADEKPEDLYQCIIAFIDDNLMRTCNDIKHHDETITEDEYIHPTLENVIVLFWLQLSHKDLPRLVKQRYGTELRSCSLASIKRKVSQALNSLLKELRNNDG